jgi:pilus assembly protein CpaE
VAAQRKPRAGDQRGKVFTVVNAKGGNGATTVAVNTALALQAARGSVALVDMAPIGNAVIHLNVRPAFTVVDAFQNLHRLDVSLLESYMAQKEGLDVLAGAATPFENVGSTDLARLFDVLVGHYQYVVVDVSSRWDGCTRLISHLSDKVLLVAHADVTSLWTAAHVRAYLDESRNSDRIHLILNRFRKIAGFRDADAENAVGAKVFWKVPNHFHAASAAIDQGVPVVQQDNSELAKSLAGLAAALTEAEDAKRKRWSLFGTAA